MAKTKLLITGAKGQLGSELTVMLEKMTSQLGDLDDIYETAEFMGVDIGELDITDFDAVSDLLFEFMPDIVINCAANAVVDQCEADLESAFAVNAIGPRNLALVCGKINAKLVHISTDYVFSGDSKTPYGEWDICDPQNVYGKSKFLGEQYVRDFAKKYFIIRTSWLYGKYGSNFVKTIADAAVTKDEIPVVTDQIGSPTNAHDLSYHILKLALTEYYGIYHITGKGECSWFTFASRIVELLNLNCRILPCSSQEYTRSAKRPSYSVLNNLMLPQTIGNTMRYWDDALKSFFNI